MTASFAIMSLSRSPTISVRMSTVSRATMSRSVSVSVAFSVSITAVSFGSMVSTPL